jgi:hypothetical protein
MTKNEKKKLSYKSKRENKKKKQKHEFKINKLLDWRWLLCLYAPPLA